MQAMMVRNLNKRPVGRMLGPSGPRHPGFRVRNPLAPAMKFSDVLFIYKLSDQERSRLGVGPDNPGYVVVV